MASSLDSDQARHIFCNSLNLDLSNECPQPLSMSVRNMIFVNKCPIYHATYTTLIRFINPTKLQLRE